VPQQILPEINAVEHPDTARVDPAANIRRERLSFGAFTFTRSPAGRCIAQVDLEYDGRKFTGKCEGQSSPLGDLRLGAEAAMNAIENFTEGTLGLELLGVKLVRAFDANVVIVSCAQRTARSTRLVGCYLSDRDTVRGAALAVLNATNRVLGNYLTTR
jgi:hypothetical protein